MITKKEAEAKYGVPCYPKWDLVPPNLKTRASLKEMGIDVPKTAKPDAVKNHVMTSKNQVYFLFNINKYKNL